MSLSESELLEAVPAAARRILVIGQELWGHREIWQRRNPLALIDPASAPWAATPALQEGRKVDAAILDIDELGGDAPAAIRWASAGLAALGTVALLVRSHRDGPALQGLAPVLAEAGLVRDRWIGDAAEAAGGILRYARGTGNLPRLWISGHEFPEISPLSDSVRRVRLHEPFEQFNSLPGIRCRIWAGNGPPPVVDADAANILLVQRMLFTRPERYQDPAQAQNYLTIAELDDLLFINGDVDPELCRANLGRFHALQVSTPELASQFRVFNPEVGVFSNHLPRIRPLPPQPPREPGQPVRILFAATGRQKAWQEIAPACRELLAFYGNAVMMVVVGDRKFMDQLQPPNGEFRPVLAYPDYLAELEKADIALLPLADNRFDRCKTDLKFIECAEAGTAVVASRVVYGESVRSGETGLLYNNKYQFRQHLKTLIDDAPLRDRLAAAAHRYVREERALANHLQPRIAWYRSLLERRAELDLAVKRRIGKA